MASFDNFSVYYHKPNIKIGIPLKHIFSPKYITDNGNSNVKKEKFVDITWLKTAVTSINNCSLDIVLDKKN